MPKVEKERRSAMATGSKRTHEENQERAYIAASRRSDRSLEARVESARRASEIHKLRTGRALKVDEAAVAGEEMYDEVDDDEETMHRRLYAYHASMEAQRSHMTVNERLADFLKTQFLQRRAFMHQAKRPRLQPQPSVGPYPQGSFYAGYPFTGMPSVVANAPSPALPSPHGHAFAQSTYQHFQQPPHASNPQPVVHYAPTGPPPSAQNQPFHQTSHASAPSQTPQPQHMVAMPFNSATAPSNGAYHTLNPAYSGYGHTAPAGGATDPLSMALPPAVQQIAGPMLDVHDPYTATLMEGSQNIPQPQSSWMPSPEIKVPPTSQSGNSTNSCPMGQQMGNPPNAQTHQNTSSLPNSAVSSAASSPLSGHVIPTCEIPVYQAVSQAAATFAPSQDNSPTSSAGSGAHSLARVVADTPVTPSEHVPGSPPKERDDDVAVNLLLNPSYDDFFDEPYKYDLLPPSNELEQGFPTNDVDQFDLDDFLNDDAWVTNASSMPGHQTDPTVDGQTFQGNHASANNGNQQDSWNWTYPA